MISPNAMNAFLPSNISNSSITPATPPTIPIASINTINDIFIFNKIPPFFTIVYHLTYLISGPYIIDIEVLTKKTKLTINRDKKENLSNIRFLE